MKQPEKIHAGASGTFEPLTSPERSEPCHTGYTPYRYRAAQQSTSYRVCERRSRSPPGTFGRFLRIEAAPGRLVTAP